MSRVTKAITIKAESKKVLDYIANVENHPAFISALKTVSKIKGDPKRIGTSWDWTFMMAGVEFKGRAETADYVEGKRYSFKTTTGIMSTFTYSVEPKGTQTQLKIDVEYTLPQNMLGKLADKAFVEKMNEKEGDRAVQNLQAILEA